MEYKGFKGGLPLIAEALNIRYCIEGSVRKHGEQIKISVSLFDAKLSETIWNESHRGSMDDIFDIQESVATKSAEALKITLSLEQKEKLASHSTLNAEAYEYLMRAVYYIELNSKSDLEYALELLDQAIAIDPNYATAFAFKASALAVQYRIYDRSTNQLELSRELITKALSLKSDLAEAYFALATVETTVGNLEGALKASQRVIELEPTIIRGYFSMGFAYSQAGKIDDAIVWYQKSLVVNPEHTSGFWNLYIQYSKLQDQTNKNLIASSAISLFERRLKLQPEDQFLRTSLANFYSTLGRSSEASALIAPLVESPTTDSLSLYNIACLFVSIGKFSEAIRTLYVAFERGYQGKQLLQSDPDLNPLRELPEFKELLEKCG